MRWRENRPTDTGKQPAKGPKGPSFFIFPMALLFLLAALIAGEAASRSTGREARTTDKGKKGEAKDGAKGKTKRKGKAAEDAEAATEQASESLFLPESDDSQGYVPEVFRCAECGYEQDEPGLCPDHEANPLVQVISMGKNPLEPPEVDGNEDILVDIPLTGLKFKKAVVATGTLDVASGTASPDKPSASGP